MTIDNYRLLKTTIDDKRKKRLSVKAAKCRVRFNSILHVLLVRAMLPSSLSDSAGRLYGLNGIRKVEI